MINGTVHNNPECLCLKQQKFQILKEKVVELQEDIDKSTIRVRDFKITSSLIDRKGTQKISRIEKTGTILSTNLIGTYKPLYPTTVG